MHRLLTDTASLGLERPALAKEALRHLKVLRLQEEEQIELFDGEGAFRLYAYRDGGVNAVSEIRRVPRPSPRLTLFACVTKGSRWDWTVEKATELGVGRIVPVISERTIVRIATADREAKRERWMRIAADAARQCDAKWLPEVCAPVDFSGSLAMVRDCRCFVGALTDPKPRALAAEVAAAMREDGGGDCDWAVYVGPEGDFTPEELSRLTETAVPTDFGATVLRAETAAIFSLSVLKGMLERETAVTRR
jgi:16S rRNA (uracil1498-N3)-methyltransferase